MVVLLALGVGALASRAQGPEPGMARTTKAELDRWMQELSNWGRWGADDELGALNTITPAKRREAAALVTEGTAVSLAHDLITERAADAPSPYVLDMGIFPERQVTRDRIDIDFHGGTFTHLDALCHVAHDGRFYNGVPYESATPAGCAKMGIDALADGIVTRAVLLDMPRLKGVPSSTRGRTSTGRTSSNGSGRPASRSHRATPSSCAQAAGPGAPRSGRAAGPASTRRSCPSSPNATSRCSAATPRRRSAGSRAARATSRPRRCAGFRCTSSPWSRAG